MFEWLDQLIEGLGLEGAWLTLLRYSLRTMLVAFLCFGLFFVAKRLFSAILYRIPPIRKSKLVNAAKRSRLIPRIIHLITPLIIRMTAAGFGKAEPWMIKAATVYTIIIIMLIVDSLLEIIDELYRMKDISKRRPIKGLLQVVEIVIFVVLGIVIIASWINEDPLVLLSGFGAFAAVLSFVFKDTLLGFIAGIQLTTDDLVRIGDWIEVPGHNIDGTVSDITLISVKIDNFDNTTSTVPAYTLVTNTFKNWRKMSQTEGRRIKRAVHVDVNSVRFCSEEMLDEFSKIRFLDHYIRDKREAGRTPVKGDAPGGDTANALHLTNIGVFRKYLELYMENHPDIRKDMMILVRQLTYQNRGVPIEVYAFSAKTDWAEYEGVQADIFDHIYAIAPVFGITLFQEIGSGDLRSVRE
ncbi:MAG: mechanosensitive ion channel [Oscillospiraceae bacterium]|nr:mechanosensitive ion channel [Oscillospiraceae bacterium]